MRKILVTGGSGFIGTNLIETLLKDTQNEILSIDMVEPKIDSHRKVWKKVDIREKEPLIKVVTEFEPEYVIHLAARTDLNGKELKDYDAAMGGVRNMLEALDKAGSVKQAVFASSYVCEPGYMPKDFEDYKPHTLYGESK